MRIRTIKPDFFKSETVARLCPYTRLLFQGLWCLSDREGRLEDRPRRIKAEVLPYDDDFDVDAGLSRLEASGMIKRYEGKGLKCIQVCGFTRHQRITGKEAETKSILPPPPGYRASSRRACNVAPAEAKAVTDEREGKKNGAEKDTDKPMKNAVEPEQEVAKAQPVSRRDVVLKSMEDAGVNTAAAEGNNREAMVKFLCINGEALGTTGKEGKGMERKRNGMEGAGAPGKNGEAKGKERRAAGADGSAGPASDRNEDSGSSNGGEVFGGVVVEGFDESFSPEEMAELGGLKPMPKHLQTVRVDALWRRWLWYRMNQSTKSTWKGMFNEQLEWMQQFEESSVYEILSASLRNNWRGLFEPKDPKRRPGALAVPAPTAGLQDLATKEERLRETLRRQGGGQQ